MPSQTPTRDLHLKTSRAFLPFLEPARYKGAFGGRGSGKCLGRGTLVMRYDGSLVPVEDVTTNDELMGPDSTPRRVLATTQGVGPLFRVHQRTAESYVVNDAHILALQRSNSAKADYVGYGTDVTLISALAYSLQTERFKAQVFGYRVPVAFESRPVERKKQVCQAVRKDKNWHYTRVDVEPLGLGDYFGFALDGDHLFLLADGTVTHNSHCFGEMLIERCLMEPGTRAVCIREFQLSLKQSVKRLLDDKIKDFGAGYAFRSLETHIETPGDGIIIFQGMQSHNAESIKSLEAYHIAWVEEAQSLSQRSLDLLRPTLREEGSELWFTWNPRNATDPVDAFLRGTPAPPNSVVRKVSWRDNPFFPDVLRTELEWDRRRDPDKYQHVWEGGYERNSESRVFKNWRIEEFETPEDAVLYCGGDWGFSVDPAVLVRCFLGKNKKTLYIDHEAYQVGVEIDHLPVLFDRVPNARELVIVADSARPETISYMKRHGFPRMEKSLKGKDSVKEGVIFLQGYDIVVHPRCIHTIDELTMYSYKTDKLTGMVTNILEDKKNHVIDSLRYAVERLRKATAEGTWGR